MASPFPGMDPYLEQFWRDVYARLIIYAADQLQGNLPSDLRARVEERVVVEPGEGEWRSVYPDVRVVERGRGPSAAGMTICRPISPEEEPIKRPTVPASTVSIGGSTPESATSRAT